MLLSPPPPPPPPKCWPRLWNLCLKRFFCWFGGPIVLRFLLRASVGEREVFASAAPAPLVPLLPARRGCLRSRSRGRRARVSSRAASASLRDATPRPVASRGFPPRARRGHGRRRPRRRASGTPRRDRAALRSPEGA